MAEYETQRAEMKFADYTQDIAQAELDLIKEVIRIAGEIVTIEADIYRNKELSELQKTILLERVNNAKGNIRHNLLTKLYEY